jgi:DNA mismatch endonuclease (patch repair protein)
MDIVNGETRSKMMSSVRSKNTKLELEIRRRLHSMGFRYGLHRKDLPGKPDLVFPKYTAIIFVNGCFWHYHGCRRTQIPKTRMKWWKEKLESNRRRDEEDVTELKDLGRRILIIWECSVRKPGINRIKALNQIAERAAKFLCSRRSFFEIPAKKRYTV